MSFFNKIREKYLKKKFVTLRSEWNVKCMYGTSVVWLQNEAGFTKWAPVSVLMSPKLAFP